MNLETFDQLPDLPLGRRWRQQRYPAPIVVALIQHPAPQSEPGYLLIRRNGKTYGGRWALVGGKWDFGETMAAAVEREVKEETGLESNFIGLRGLVSERVAPPDRDENGAHFLLLVCELAVQSGNAQEQHEGAVAWFTMAEIEALHKESHIIPSDFAMIRKFAGTAGTAIHFEAEMLSSLGLNSDDQAELVRFERIGQPEKDD